MPMPPCKVDVTLDEGDEIEVGTLKLKVWHTPGHTAGPAQLQDGRPALLRRQHLQGRLRRRDRRPPRLAPARLRDVARSAFATTTRSTCCRATGRSFRRDNKLIQKTIDRLTQYQHMADFGTCAVDWPLLEQWEKDVSVRENAEVRVTSKSQKTNTHYGFCGRSLETSDRTLTSSAT